MIHYRVRVEVEYFIALTYTLPELSGFPKDLEPKLRVLYKDFSRKYYLTYIIDGKTYKQETGLSDAYGLIKNNPRENKALKDNYFTGTFDKQQLPRILEHLRISSNIRYRIIDPKSGDEGLKERSKVELY